MLLKKRLVGSAAVVAAALAFVGALDLFAGCNGGNPSTSTSGSTEPTPTGGSCNPPSQGCPCTTPGATRACGTSLGVTGGTITCSSGEMVCLKDDTWGACSNTVRTALPISRLTPRKIPFDLSNDAGGCNDPCDPYCQAFGDTPNGLDAGAESGLAVTDSGLSLGISPNPPPIPCTGIVVTPGAATVVLTSLNPATPPTQQFTAQYQPPTCYNGAVNALWTVDKASIAQVDATGKVTVVNPVAGKITVTALVGGVPPATATLTVVTDIVELSADAGVTAGQMSGTGSGNDTMFLAYPYQYTVFPLGLIPPTVQWTTGAGAVTGLTLTSGGSNYTSAPTIAFTGGGGGGAAATASISGSVAAGAVTNPGSGYTAVPAVTLAGGGGTGATATATLTGTLAEGTFAVPTPGQGYTAPASVTFTGGGGSGAVATATVGGTTNLTTGTFPTTTAGSGYLSPTTVAISGGGGSGAVASANLATTGSLVTGTFPLATQGSGYTSPPSPVFSGGGAGASATTTLAAAGAVKTGTFPTTTAGTGFTSAPSVTFTGGGATTQATGTATLGTGTVTTGTFPTTATGSGYTSAPTVTFSGGGGTTQATGTATLAGAGSVRTGTFATTTPGSGYTAAPTVTFSGGGATTQATGSATLASTGSVLTGTFAPSNPGSGYTSPPTVTFSGGGGTTQATGSTTLATAGSVLLGTFPTTATGSGYVTAPNVVFSGGGGTTQATGTANLGTGSVVTGTFAPSAGGSGYRTAPNVTFTGGGGTTQATGSATIAGPIDTVTYTITNPGSGYTSAPLATLSGGGPGSGGAVTPVMSQYVSSVTYNPPVVNGYTGIAWATVGGVGVTLTGGGFTTAATVTGAGQSFTNGLTSTAVTGAGAGYAPNCSMLVTFTRAGATSATATLRTTATGAIPVGTSITILNPGQTFGGAPTGAAVSGCGAGTTNVGFGAYARGNYNELLSISVSSGGSGYTSAPTVGFTSIAARSGVPTGIANLASFVQALTITGGSGYTSAPTVAFSGGGGSNAAATLFLNGSVTSVIVATGGAGYTSTPSVSFPPTSGGSGAAFTPTVAYGVASVTVATGGAGYTSPPTVTFIPTTGGSGATFTNPTLGYGVATITVATGGAGYTSVPLVTFTGGGGGSGAAFTPTLGYGVATITIATGGSGYTSLPTVTFTPSGGGSGASYTPVLTYGVVSVTVATGGAGYTSVPLVTFTGGGGGSGASFTPAVTYGVATVTVATGGAGYTSVPTVTFSGGGGGSGATFTPTLVYAVASITISAGGAGYTAPATITFTGGGGGSGASFTPTLAYGVASVTISNGGTGYTSAPTFTFTGAGGSGSGATFTGAAFAQGITSITITNGGTGYTSVPTVAFGGGGSGASFVPTLTQGVGAITITAAGSGYTSAPTVTIAPPTTGTQATGTVSLSASVITVALTAGGSGYSTVPTVVFSGGGGSGAAATATISGGGSSADAVKVSLLFPADGSIFTYSEILPENSSQYGPPDVPPGNINFAMGFSTPHASFATSVWNAFAQAAIGQTAYVAVQRRVTGTLLPAKTVRIKFASNQLKGTVYYNTYGTNLAHNFWYAFDGTSTFGAATLGINLAASPPTLSLIEGFDTLPPATNGTGCRVCHSVSSDGNRLVTQEFLGGDLKSDTLSLPGGTEAAMTNPDGTFAWPALNNNASLLFTNAAPLAGAKSSASSALYSLATPTAPTTVAGVSGLPAVKAGTPSFSPDGKHLAFNLNGGAGSFENLAGTGTTTADGKSIGVIDFDGVSAFSNPRVVATPGSNGVTSVSGGVGATNILWFPAFTPDNANLIFHDETYGTTRDQAGTRSECDARGPVTCQNEGAHAELWWVPTTPANSSSKRLDCLNGLSDANCPTGTTGTSYLPPHPAYAPPYSSLSKYPTTPYAADWNLNYEPTMLPQASGGYAWVVFTSRRQYGNVATVNPFWSDPRYEDLSVQPTTKKLWVAAVDLNPTPGTDPSHPAFYLDGQEMLAGNSRGYWALNACENAGTGPTSLCTSDLDCCTGSICQLDNPLPSPPTSHCTAKPSGACVVTGSACTPSQVCCEAATKGAICSQQAPNVCVIPPPLPYYQEADFVRDYASPCPFGKKAIWQNFQYGTITPSDSKIIINVETANNQSFLTDTNDAGAANASAPLVQLPQVVSGATIVYPTGSQNVEAALESIGDKSATYLRVIVRLIPSTDGRSPPTLTQWNQTFDCVDAQ